MNFKADILIEATKEQVWQVISDIEGAKDRISAIQSVEILEQPKNSFVGLKWTETRIMFGKSATETMWITDAKDNDYYHTRAESHGAIYISKLILEEKEGGTLLTMTFDGTPQTIMAKIMSAVLGPMFKKATLKAIEQDLKDIKVSVEKENSKT